MSDATDSSAVLAARQYLSTILSGEWKWEPERLIASDGTVVLWSSTDIHGVQYIGVMADYEEFLMHAAMLLKALVAEIDQLAQSRDR